MIIAASGVVRRAKRKGVSPGSWVARMLGRKPPVLVIVALANTNARVAWALSAKRGIYRAPAVTAFAAYGREAVDGVSRSNDRYGAMSVRHAARRFACPSFRSEQGPV